MRNAFILLLSVLVLILAGCEQGGDGSAASVASTSDNDGVFFSKVALDEATLDEVRPFVSECQGNKLCVEICHRPPGNPTNSKTKMLPLSATAAHLNHGGPHTEKDYLGACQTEDSGGGSEDPTNEDPTGEDPNGEDPGGGGSDTPAWCVPFIQYDADCDGYNDETGETYI